jgi:predicted permease
LRRLRALLLRFTGLFGREQRERELDEEITSNLALHTEENMRNGMPREEARRKALIKLGGVEATKELYRERRSLPLIETMWQDLRFAARMLWKSPGFTIVAVLALALGIGANSALFSIVNSVILRPLPYKDSERIVTLHTHTAAFPRFTMGLTWPAFQAVRARQGALEQVVACWSSDRTLTHVQEPTVLNVVGVSPGFFEELSGQARLGRLLSDQDQSAGQNRTAVVSEKLWRTRFANDPAVLGRSMVLDGEVYTIVGVVAANFDMPEQSDVWVPIHLTEDNRQNPALFAFGVLGKLRPGANVAQLQVELSAMAPGLGEQLAKRMPDLKGGYQLTAETLLDSTVQDSRRGYLMLFASATLVLMIACANLTSMLLARGWGRQREIALRGAMGATPSRLRRQFLVESGLLATLGGIAGIGIAFSGIQAFRMIAPADTQRIGEVSADWTLLWFALASSLVAGLAFGWIPARRAARVTPNEMLKEGGGGSLAGKSRIGSALVVAEVAMAFILLIGSTLMLQTLAHLLSQNPGFRTDHLLTLDLPQATKWFERSADATTTKQIADLQQMLANIRRIPGVESVVAADHGLLNGMEFSKAGVKLEGTPSGHVAAGEGLSSRFLSPGYFQTFAIPILRGREFDEGDVRSSRKVIVVNEEMARRFWGTLDVLGKRVSVSKDDKGIPEWNEIIGVVANVRDLSIQNDPGPEYFLALFQWGVSSHHLIVRTRLNPESLAHTISQQVWASKPDQPVTHISTLTATIAESIGDQRLHTTLLGIFAAVGLTLALLGVYGVVFYSVARRTQEIGVRIALGASRGDVLRLVLRQGFALVALGAGIGAVGAIAATRVIAAELYGVKPGDPWTYISGIALILLVGCAACWLPAYRAMRVDPILALRHD